MKIHSTHDIEKNVPLGLKGILKGTPQNVMTINLGGRECQVTILKASSHLDVCFGLPKNKKLKNKNKKVNKAKDHL